MLARRTNQVSAMNRCRIRSLLAVVAAVGGAVNATGQAPAAAQGLVRDSLAPTHADSSVHRFTAPNYVVFEKETPSSAPLLVFMPGTNGQPNNATNFAD